jgi:hypothetical protein
MVSIGRASCDGVVAPVPPAEADHAAGCGGVVWHQQSFKAPKMAAESDKSVRMRGNKRRQRGKDTSGSVD